ncbi:MAG: energy transducer TonB [Acidobacteria bacterium]|nr:energy transducer TonB [Acidobacteriota bacterium]
MIPLDKETAAASDDIRRSILQKSLAFTGVVEKLWETFRLDPERRLQKSLSSVAEIGRPFDLPSVEGSGVRITAELVSLRDKSVVYRITFRQGDRMLADSNATVARNGRAVVGGMNGSAAPYIFVVIEPAADAPDTTSPAGSAGITAPTVISKVQPQYPQEARKEGIRGVVLIQATIDENGVLAAAEVIESPDPRLSQAALEAIRQWTFKPALGHTGRPVKVLSTFTFRFELR